MASSQGHKQLIGHVGELGWILDDLQPIESGNYDGRHQRLSAARAEESLLVRSAICFGFAIQQIVEGISPVASFQTTNPDETADENDSVPLRQRRRPCLSCQDLPGGASKPLIPEPASQRQREKETMLGRVSAVPRILKYLQ
jgi:hypothetical protein